MKELLHAGGYGFYLWMSYGMVLLCLVLESTWCRKKLAKALKRISRSVGN